MEQPKSLIERGARRYLRRFNRRTISLLFVQTLLNYAYMSLHYVLVSVE